MPPETQQHNPKRYTPFGCAAGLRWLCRSAGSRSGRAASPCPPAPGTLPEQQKEETAGSKDRAGLFLSTLNCVLKEFGGVESCTCCAPATTTNMVYTLTTRCCVYELWRRLPPTLRDPLCPLDGQVLRLHDIGYVGSMHNHAQQVCARDRVPLRQVQAKQSQVGLEVRQQAVMHLQQYKETQGGTDATQVTTGPARSMTCNCVWVQGQWI